VYVRNFSTGATWLTGKIKECNSLFSFTICLSDDCIVKCHIDHICSHNNSTEVNPPSEQNLDDALPAPSTACLPYDILLEFITLLNDLHNFDSKEGGV